MVRERKIVKRFEKHIHAAAQSIEDERATRTAKFHLLTEDVDVVERYDDRQVEAFTKETFDKLLEVDAVIKEETVAREKADQVLLSTMLEAQGKLQDSILRAFGPDAPDEDDP